MIQALLLTILLANPSQFNHLQIDQTEGGWADELAAAATAKPDLTVYVNMTGDFIIGSDINPFTVTSVQGTSTFGCVLETKDGNLWFAGIPQYFIQEVGSDFIIMDDILPYQVM